MDSLVPTGPQVPDHEDAYRAVLYPSLWIDSEQRPSTAVFSDELFSVDLKARTTPAETRARFRIVHRLVEFNCGVARGLGFDTRDEPDPHFPENKAHVHVYFLDYRKLTKSGRKIRAMELVRACVEVP